MTEDLVNHSREGHGGVDHNPVLSLPPLIFRSLVKPPVHCVNVDFKDNNAVKQINDSSFVTGARRQQARTLRAEIVSDASELVAVAVHLLCEERQSRPLS